MKRSKTEELHPKVYGTVIWVHRIKNRRSQNGPINRLGKSLKIICKPNHGLAFFVSPGDLMQLPEKRLCMKQLLPYLPYGRVFSKIVGHPKRLLGVCVNPHVIRTVL